MNPLEHPLFGDYAGSQFGVLGRAECFADFLPERALERISIYSPYRWGQPGGLTFADAPPEGHARRRYQFGISLQHIETILPWRHGTDTTRYFVQGPGIGQVDHVLGRSAEDYIDEGSTAQMLADCLLELAADPSGLRLQFSGTLSDEGFLRPVEPLLRQEKYLVRCMMPWTVARFFFSTNSIAVMYEKCAAMRD